MTVPQASADARRRVPLAVGDVVLGALSVVGGVAVVIYAQSMPTVGGLPGPGLFPMIIGWFLVVLGATLAVKAVIAGRRGVAIWDAASRVPGGTAEQAQGDRGTDEGIAPVGNASETSSTVVPVSTAQGGHWSGAAVVLGGIVFYVLAAELLGFPITMFLVLAAVMLVLRSRVVAALLTAAGVTAALYAVFELLLLVQLPDGFLG